MRKFVFVFLLLVASTSLPLFLNWETSTSSTDVLSTDENTEAEVSETTTPETVPFTDIADHWAKDAIETLQEKGVVSGYEDGRFGPNDPVTRAQIMKMALEAFHIDTSTAPTTSSFTDLPPDDWATPYISTAAAIGITSGYEDHTFQAQKPVTRGEALKIILEAGGFTDLSDTTGNFTDVDSIRDWFAKYSAFAKKAGIVSGYNGKFEGNKTVTRAEVCVMLEKVIDYLNGTE